MKKLSFLAVAAIAKPSPCRWMAVTVFIAVAAAAARVTLHVYKEEEE